MADYLTRLASRTLGLTPVVEPVIAPLFAPGQTSMKAMDSEAPLDEPRTLRDTVMESVHLHKTSTSLPEKAHRPVRPQSESEQKIHKTMSQPPMVDEQAPDAGPPIHVKTERQSKARLLHQVLQTEGSPEADLLLPLPPPLAPELTLGVPASARAGKKAEPGSSASVPERSGVIAPPTVSVVRHETERKPSVPLPEEITQFEETPTLSGRVDPTASIPMKSSSPHETQGVPLLVPLLLPKTPFPRRETQVLRRQQSEGIADPEKEAPAAIEITIGRVEVRAVYPPAPTAHPRSAAPPRPRLSLEEYLRNQNGEKR